MAGIQRIDDARSAAALADLLNGNGRRRPVVVVTIPAGRTEPWIDAEEIARETGSLADVYLMPTGEFTWEFSRRMVEGTQVYGGAGRAYPVGHEWASDLTKSPLRFAFDADDGESATQELISDALRMAAATGLLASRPARALRRVVGVVKGIVAGRAFVDIGKGLPATVAEELILEDVLIGRVLAVGQRIEGWYDAETNRIDVAKGLRSADDALRDYSPDDVVLARVAMVRNGKADLVLYPRTTNPAIAVTVLREDVTTNPLDDLRTLMTVGEVVPARVVSIGPKWSLIMSDVDDDEPILTAPALLPGGPPWLIEEPDDVEPELPQPSAPPVLLVPARPEATVEELPAEEPLVQEPAPAPPLPKPKPSMLDRNRPRSGRSPAAPPAASPAAPPAPVPAESTRALLRQIDGLKAQVAELERDKENLRVQKLAAEQHGKGLKRELDDAGRHANMLKHELKAAKARLRKAGNRRSAEVLDAGPKFADSEQGFRYLVLTQWATRTLPGEQSDRPLPDYIIGPRFLDSLRRLEGIKDEKVADVAFEIVTGLAPSLSSREVHQLRTGPGGDDPIRVRDDGAVAWRASLQVNTPSARRIHYWVLPNGQIELARVTTHDDFDA
ncbi:MAG TPA: hypothetical protein VFC82_05415 [Actinomycetaceae bacterium]|nr:hypothetical protein [Actinomycetaceae bacterium]